MCCGNGLTCTTDTQIFSLMLYYLSYNTIFCKGDTNRTHIIGVGNRYSTIKLHLSIFVGAGGFEPPMFHVCLIYSQVPSTILATLQYFFLFICLDGKTRTYDHMIPNHVCYQLHHTQLIAEDVGFEPTSHLHDCLFSRQVPSTTRSIFHDCGCLMRVELISNRTTICYFTIKLHSSILYKKRDLNPHSHNDYRILSPVCIPIPPFLLHLRVQNYN